MKIITALIIVAIVATGLILFNRLPSKQSPPQTAKVTSSSPRPQEKVDIKASFKIITHGTVRIFTDPKYHRRSEDVFIEPKDPSIVLVKRKGITWDDFFKTLPMKLTKDCLTTGTGQVFCTGGGGILKFYLNDVEDKDLLDKEIKQGDRILIKFIKEVPLFEIIAKNLEVPWALAFLPASPAGGPNGDILVTERIGTVKLTDKNRAVKEVGKIVVKQVSESGLHGIAIHPKFPQSPYIYLYYTYSAASDNTFNKVSRFTFDGQSIKDEKVIVDKIPGATVHDGGRIKFGPDGYLYITTGDALNPSLAQDKNSLAGKILRVKDEEKVEVYSYGHRNPQGITWDEKGQLWETEHGQTATDEVNLIEPGQNYGWPEIRGEQTKDGMITPKLQSGSATWAPAGAAFLDGSIYFGGLRGQALYQLKLETLQLKEHFKGQFGRIRDVVLGPDNMLYITTSNKDGRGNPTEGDDKIIKINPEKL